MKKNNISSLVILKIKDESHRSSHWRFGIYSRSMQCTLGVSARKTWCNQRNITFLSKKTRCTDFNRVPCLQKNSCEEKNVDWIYDNPRKEFIQLLNKVVSCSCIFDQPLSAFSCMGMRNDTQRYYNFCNKKNVKTTETGHWLLTFRWWRPADDDDGWPTTMTRGTWPNKGGQKVRMNAALRVEIAFKPRIHFKGRNLFSMSSGASTWSEDDDELMTRRCQQLSDYDDHDNWTRKIGRGRWPDDGGL